MERIKIPSMEKIEVSSHSPFDDSVTSIDSSMEFSTPEELLSEEVVYRVLIFGNPGTGKTHFAESMPGPVYILDSENRAKIIIGKFKNKDGTQKRIYVKQWRTQDDLELYIEIAIKALNNHYAETGERGTLVVDSYTKAWDAAHNKYIIDKFGRSADPSIRLDPMSDYKFINPIHNNLREKILDSGFHVCLTATQGSIFGEDRYNPIGVRPEGQKHNQYAVDFFIFNYFEGNAIYSSIQKNSLVSTDVSIGKIKELTFDKLNEAVTRIKKSIGIPLPEEVVIIEEPKTLSEEIPEPEPEETKTEKITKLEISETGPDADSDEMPKEPDKKEE